MISALGGTLGLCIGFSFSDFASKWLILLNSMVKNNKIGNNSEDVVNLMPEGIARSMERLETRQKIHETSLDKAQHELKELHKTLESQVMSLKKTMDEFQLRL